MICLYWTAGTLLMQQWQTCCSILRKLELTSMRCMSKRDWSNSPCQSLIQSNAMAFICSVGLQSRFKSNKQQQLSTLKNNCSLFSRLYVASQVRDGDLDEFFQHENQPCPPSLSQVGMLRGGTKSDLLSCLQDLAPVNVHSPTGVTCTILDGAAIVNMLKPGNAKTFQDYATDVFCIISHPNSSM